MILAVVTGACRIVVPAIVLNEVLHDPVGADGGYEFVELAAASGADSTASLEGWTLETGNGARPGEWTLAWTGGPVDRLRGGRFVIGESAVEPRPDAVVDLDLQNGPDACRLVDPAGRPDVLGWGTPLDAALYEGSPAPDVSGLSLARLPDGLDTDDNAADFRPAAPSPGAYNAPADSIVVESFMRAGDSFRWIVRNVGRRVGVAHVRAACGVHPDERLAEAESAPLAPGERITIAASGGAPPGLHLPRSVPDAPGADAPWAGTGRDVFVTEAMSRPQAGQSEWVEIEAEAEIDLAAFGIEDASGTRGALAGRIAAGGRALLCADTAAVRARWRPPPGVPLVQASPWPSLNHTGGAGSVAERIALLVGALEADAAALPGAGAAGISWERASRALPGEEPSSWSHSRDPGGATPGRANSLGGDRIVTVPAEANLHVDPSPFRPGRDAAALIVLRTGGPDTRCRMTVFDSWGVRVAGLQPWTAGAGEHRAVWNGNDSTGQPATLGLYLVRAETEGRRPVHATLVVER